jgi:hypothetical protein
MENFKQYIIPVILIAFLISRKIRRTIGFQKYSKPRLIIRIVILSIVTLPVLALAALHPISLVSDTVGVLIGFVLLFFATKNTVFEKRNDNLFYRTHIWIELLILFIFFGRLLYRISIMYRVLESSQSQYETRSQLESMRDPFTAAVFFIICTYYIGYFSFILKRAAKPLEENINV